MTMLCSFLLQSRYGYGDLAKKETLHKVMSLRRFASLLPTRGSFPNGTTVRKFRRLPETHDLAQETLITVNKHLSNEGVLLREGTIIGAAIIEVFDV